MNEPAYITVRKHSFLSSAALGFSAIIITLLVTGTVVTLYTIHLAGDKSERVLTLAQSAIKGLPDFTRSLPPALSDMLDDRRRPEYCKELAISARATALPDAHGRVRTTVEIVNNGPEVVSLLAMRILLVDDQNQILSESQEWAATPVAADQGWRGPIMPGSRRHFVCYQHVGYGLDCAADLKTEVEITELRVWNNTGNTAPANSRPTGPTAVSTPGSVQPPEKE